MCNLRPGVQAVSAAVKMSRSDLKKWATRSEQSESVLLSAVLSCFRSLAPRSVGRFFSEVPACTNSKRPQALQDKCIVSVNCPSGQTMVKCEARTWASVILTSMVSEESRGGLGRGRRAGMFD